MVEPYLWAADGMLWPLVPDGVRMWTVEAFAASATTAPTPRDAARTAGLDHGATYLLDLSGVG